MNFYPSIRPQNWKQNIIFGSIDPERSKCYKRTYSIALIVFAVIFTAATLGVGYILVNKLKNTRTQKANEIDNKAKAIIQAAALAFVERKKLSQNQSLRTPLGAAATGYLARSERKKTQAAIVIQNAYRSHKARVELEVLKVEDKFKSVQAGIRGKNERVQYKNLRKETKISELQAGMKGYLVRTQLNKNQNAALVIQKAFRSHQARKRLSTLKIERNFKPVQAALRGKNERVQYLNTRKESKIQTLQAGLKGFIERQNLRNQKHAAQIIQNAFRCHSSRIELAARKLDKQLHNVGAAAKGFLERKKVQEYRLAQIQAAKEHLALSVQPAVKSYQARRKLKIQRIVQLQGAIRGFLERSRFPEKKQVHDISIIQAAIRGYLTRANLAKTQKSSFAIQHAFKTYIKQTKTHREKALQSWTAKFGETTQAAIKGAVERKKYRQTLQAILVLQSAVRMRTGKFEMPRIFLDKEKYNYTLSRSSDDFVFKIALAAKRDVFKMMNLYVSLRPSYWPIESAPKLNVNLNIDDFHETYIFQKMLKINLNKLGCTLDNKTTWLTPTVLTRNSNPIQSYPEQTSMRLKEAFHYVVQLLVKNQNKYGYSTIPHNDSIIKELKAMYYNVHAECDFLNIILLTLQENKLINYCTHQDNGDITVRLTLIKE